jgi:hypothetical protein
VIRALISIGFLQFLSMLLLLARTKIIALVLGPEGVGVIATVDRVTAVIAQTLSLSLPFAALRFLPAVQRQSQEEAEALYRRMRNVSVALVVVASVVCVGITAVAPQVWGAALVSYRGALILAFAALPVIGLVPFLTSAFAAIKGHGSSMRLTVANSAVFVFAAAAAAAFGVAGFYGAYALLGTALVLAAVAKLHDAGAARVRRHRSLAETFRLPRDVWRFAVWLFPLTFIAPYAAFYVQYSTLRIYGAGTAGILVGAIGIGLSVRTLLGAAHSIFLTPNVNRQADSAERMEWANEFQRHMIVILRRGACRPLFAAIRRGGAVRRFVRIGRSDHIAVRILPGTDSCRQSAALSCGPEHHRANHHHRDRSADYPAPRSGRSGSRGDCGARLHVWIDHLVFATAVPRATLARSGAHVLACAVHAARLRRDRQYVSRHDVRKAGRTGCSVHRRVARRLCGDAG